MEKMIESELPGYQYKILTGNVIYYKCDPNLNRECDHKKCSYENTGPCEFTRKKEYTMLIRKDKR